MDNNNLEEQPDELFEVTVITVVFLLLGFLYSYYKNSRKGVVERVVHTGKSTKVKVVIHWCGGCGFKERYEAAVKQLIDKFGDDGIEIISKQDQGITGNFEIYVNGYLAHSLKTKRHGFMHNNPERQKAVFSAIEVALEEQEEEVE